MTRIFDRYAAGGVSMLALARELTADQIPSQNGNPSWDAGSLGRMLRNPAYMGRAAFGKTRTADTGPRPNRTSRLAGRTTPGRVGVTGRPRQEWIEIPVPALVSEEEATAANRAAQKSDTWQAKYALRAGVEGTINQALDVTGLRRARYRGLPKVTLQHAFSATAINIIRLDAHWAAQQQHHRPARIRTSRLTRLAYQLAA